MQTSSAASDPAQYYVYLYRDPSTMAIRYVGKGQGARAAAHLKGAANAELRAWLERLNRARLAPVIELLSCATDDEAYRVEAALISALWSPGASKDRRLFNSVRGREGRFGPLGLPRSLVDRRFAPRLTRDEIGDLGGALVVYIGPRTFENEADPRPGATPRMQERDHLVVERIVGWWQIGRLLDHWTAAPATAPRMIIGVTGPPDRRWVYGSIAVTAKEWAAATCEAGLWRVAPADERLDTKRLRGRLFERGAVGAVVREQGERGFGGIRAQFFDHVLNTKPHHRRPR